MNTYEVVDNVGTYHKIKANWMEYREGMLIFYKDRSNSPFYGEANVVAYINSWISCIKVQNEGI